MVLDSKDDQQKFVINEKKDKAIRVIIAYIFTKIFFHTSGINYLNVGHSILVKEFSHTSKAMKEQELLEEKDKEIKEVKNQSNK